MDDFPAGPASPGPRRPPLSVVIPVRDGGHHLGRCLRGLRASTYQEFELLVVDDASIDGSADLAKSFGARVVRHDLPRGPAAARNAGVEAASAPWVFFLDADVVVHPETLGRALAHVEADPGLTALFGSYDDRPATTHWVGRFRNLLHHYVHQQGHFESDRRPAHTFWTGCGLIRRRAFLDLGGFDPDLYHRPAIEDIELGYRLTRAGHRIALARDVQATHLKDWTLRQMVRTDLFQRGVPWMLLILRSGRDETDLNVSHGQRACVAATGLALLGLAASLWRVEATAMIAPAASVNLAVNRGFYRFLARRGGWAFAAASVLLHAIYFACCGASVIIATTIHCLSRIKSPMSPPRRAGGRIDSGTRSPRPSRFTRADAPADRGYRRRPD